MILDDKEENAETERLEDSVAAAETEGGGVGGGGATLSREAERRA